MRSLLKTFVIFLILPGLPVFAIAQSRVGHCVILNRVSPDEALFYFTPPISLDSTSKEQLRFMILTDRLNFYLALLPKTRHSFEKTPKLKEHLTIGFADGSVDSLEAYDLQLHREPGEILILFYRIKDDQLQKLRTNTIQRVRFHLAGESKTSYDFQVNSNLIGKKIECLMALK